MDGALALAASQISATIQGVTPFSQSFRPSDLFYICSSASLFRGKLIFLAQRGSRSVSAE